MSVGYLAFLVLTDVKIRPRFVAGATTSYVVKVSQIEYSGPGTAHVSTSSELTMPFSMRVDAARASGTDVTLTTGPVFARGHNAGRAKVRSFTLDAGGGYRGSVISWLAVPFPAQGASTGSTWRSGFFGPSPLPAGVHGDYKLVAVVGGFAHVKVKISMDGGTVVRGAGDLFVRTSNGSLDHGSANIDVAYFRPDPNDRSKMNMNSHVALKLLVAPK
jgi:hypothetical protein